MDAKCPNCGNDAYRLPKAEGYCFDCYNAGVPEFRERIAELERQLPDGMKHCTILSKECEKGHGWLTATNWVQYGCPTCERDALTPTAAVLGAAKRLIDLPHGTPFRLLSDNSEKDAEFIARWILAAANPGG